MTSSIIDATPASCLARLSREIQRVPARSSLLGMIRLCQQLNLNTFAPFANGLQILQSEGVHPLAGFLPCFQIPGCGALGACLTQAFFEPLCFDKPLTNRGHPVESSPSVGVHGTSSSRFVHRYAFSDGGIVRVSEVPPGSAPNVNRTGCCSPFAILTRPAAPRFGYYRTASSVPPGSPFSRFPSNRKYPYTLRCVRTTSSVNLSIGPAATRRPLSRM